jgi:GNAT superfamily N-acetyltransferase
MEIEVRDLRAEEKPAAGAVAGRALSDNPTFRWVWGDDTRARVGGALGLFVGFVGPLADPQLGAFLGGVVVGVCAAASPGTCIGVTAPDELRVAPTEVGPPGDPSRGLVVWSLFCRHDFDERHWHLGPVAVEPVLQGHGVGGALLNPFCERMDAAGEAVWLETDKPGNVSFYRRHGFDLVDEVTLPETDNAFTTYFMRRAPR